MTVAAARPVTQAPSAGIGALADRYDPDAIDLPGGKARVRLRIDGGRVWDAVLTRRRLSLEPPSGGEPDASLTADTATWRRIATDVRGGMDAFRRGRLRVRGSLHLGVGFLAATSGATEETRLRFESVRTRRSGRLSILSAGAGDPVICAHGLGGTKASFLPTVAALGDSYRVIAVDLPGFGESDKPIAAAYDARHFARAVFELMDALDLERAHLVGNSMGGRVVIEAGLTDEERVASLVMLSPALAWLRDRRWAPIVKALRPELGLLQVTPRPIVEGVVRRLVGVSGGWADAGIDEFLRVYLTPRGRAAFYAAARNIYLDEPHGDNGFWTRMTGLAPRSMFVWGRRDTLVPIAFMKHVEEHVPAAAHLELDCGHVPQLEAPRETHQAMRDFFG
ncbi:MAG TPA: alpha/beta fold hydrolase [Thermoleophilaceae bacterium]|nr:alpha/beta fold hydrolase [Thermoleophilaceae bacterium]